MVGLAAGLVKADQDIILACEIVKDGHIQEKESMLTEEIY